MALLNTWALIGRRNAEPRYIIKDVNDVCIILQCQERVCRVGSGYAGVLSSVIPL